MVDISAGIPSAEAIALSFPHATIKRIHGTPSCVDIDDAQEKQTENAVSRPSTPGGGGHGHAGMVVPVARYVVEFSPEIYLWEPNPGEAPVNPTGIAAVPQRILEKKFNFPSGSTDTNSLPTRPSRTNFTVAMTKNSRRDFSSQDLV